MTILSSSCAKVLATMAFFLLAAAHMIWSMTLDNTAVALFVLGVLPWLVPFLRTNFASIEGIGLKLEFVKEALEDQAKKIDDQNVVIERQRQTLDDLVLYSMAYYIFDKLKYISLGVLPDFRAKFGEYKYVKNDPFDHDLIYLRDHGYLEMFQLSDLAPGENLVGKLSATEMGNRFVQLNQHRLQ